MVDVFLDRDALLELGHAAVMIAMVMREDQVIDLGQAGIFGGGINAFRVSHGSVGIAGIDQQRFTRRRYEERPIAALDVDDVNVERRPGRLGIGRHCSGAEKGSGKQQRFTKHLILPMTACGPDGPMPVLIFEFTRAPVHQQVWRF